MLTSPSDTVASPAGIMRLRQPITWAGLCLIVLALAYLGFKTYQMAGRPGYDFRFIWLAGDLWLDGINPYSDAYERAGKLRISEGHIPTLWPYPPTWWAFSVPLGALDIYTANVVWNIANIIMIVWGTVLLSKSFVVAFPDITASIAARFGGWMAAAVFGTVLFLLSVLEATAILLSVGQTTIFACFGITLMLWSRVHRFSWVEAFGLALILLKPQIGVPYAIVLLLTGNRSRYVVLLAGVFSAILMIPAMLGDPSVFLDFVRNVTSYDDFTKANLPLSMTGMRLVIFEVLNKDIGNLIAAGLTLGVVLLACVGPTRLCRSPDQAVHAWQLYGLSTTVIVALAPLHIYDFVLLAVPLPFLFCANGMGRVLLLAGAALIWRSENLGALTGFHDPGVEIFPGSRLATIGAMIFLAGMVTTISKLNYKGPVD